MRWVLKSFCLAMLGIAYQFIPTGPAEAQAQKAQSADRKADLPFCPPVKGAPDESAFKGLRDGTPSEQANFLSIISRSPTGRTFSENFTINATQAIASFTDRTNLTYSEAHGSQVEYSTNDGRVFLWYPGNPMVLPGQWRACRHRLKASGFGKDPKEAVVFHYVMVCFRYGDNTYNPVTGKVGQSWQCTPAAQHRKALTQSEKGDALGLANRTSVPFVLGRSKTSLTDLRAQMQTTSSSP